MHLCRSVVTDKIGDSTCTWVDLYIYDKIDDSTCTWVDLLLLARLNNVHGELLYYPRRRRQRRHPQMLKFLGPHYFLTL